jgi:hypothetical protein
MNTNGESMIKRVLSILLQGSSAVLLTAILLWCPLQGQSTPSLPAAKKQEIPKAQDEEIVFFTPPSGWLQGDPTHLPPCVKVMVVGPNASTLPPSMNLSYEPYQGTLKQYLKMVKNMNIADGNDWKDLGSIKTESGTANLSQVDVKSQWGILRRMEIILIKNGYVYILTACALKDEFSRYYADFFTSMRSITIVKDAYEMVPDKKQRTQLKTDADKLIKEWQALIDLKHKENLQMNPQELREAVFDSENFQKNIWRPFNEMLAQKYAQMKPEWHSLFIQKLKDKLFMQGGT